MTSLFPVISVDVLAGHLIDHFDSDLTGLQTFETSSGLLGLGKGGGRSRCLLRLGQEGVRLQPCAALCCCMSVLTHTGQQGEEEMKLMRRAEWDAAR